MARIRTTKPEFWTSEQVSHLSRDARLAFLGMWNFSDDGGVHPASARRLRLEIFPGDELTDDDVQAMVDEMIEQGLLAEFSVDGRTYWHVTGWASHQKIDRPTYRHPQPDPADDSTPPRRTLGEDSTSDRRDLDLGREGIHKGREGKETKSASASVKPADAKSASNGEAAGTTQPASGSPKLPTEAETLLDQYAERWNSADLGAKVTTPVTSGYRRQVATAWRKSEHRDALQRIDDVFTAIAAQPHLADESWFAFDWLLKWKQGEAKPNVQKVLDRQLGGGNTTAGHSRDVGPGQVFDPKATIRAEDF